MESRARRLRQRLLGPAGARLADVEAYLRACGWRRRKSKGSHRAWIKEGKRTLIIPVHGPTVRAYVVREVLEATTDEERADSSGSQAAGRAAVDAGTAAQSRRELLRAGVGTARLHDRRAERVAGAQ